jgi:hypothetical protein
METPNQKERNYSSGLKDKRDFLKEYPYVKKLSWIWKIWHTIKGC